jgi:cation:H+ antiporter
LPAVVAFFPRRWRRERLGPLELPEPHRVELAVLAVSALWATRAVLSGRLTLLDAGVLIGMYVVYLRRAATAGGESTEAMGVAAELAALPRRQRRRWAGCLMGYAAFVILLTAVPFGEAVLGAGAIVGISPYLLLQWIVPVATETPEVVVAFVLLTHGRGGQSIAVLLAGAASQYTLALGTLPLAYAVGAGTGPLPLAGQERVELLLTIGVALYAVAALVTLRLSRGDSSIMLAVFAGQLLLPTVVTRLFFAVVFWAVALDILLSEKRRVPALLAALRPQRRSADSSGGGGPPPRGRDRSRRARSHTRSPAAASAARSRQP